MQKQKTKNKPEIKSYYNMRNFIVSCYLIFMFTVFEVILINQYADVRSVKYFAFLIATSLLFISVAVVSLAYHYEKDLTQSKLLAEQTAFFDFSYTDLAFICFFIFAIFTTIFSDNFIHSLLGVGTYDLNGSMISAGRNNGLLLIALYTVMYFIVSRYYYYKDYILILFMIFGGLISALAIVNFFYIDPLGIFKGYGENIINNFGTTIGNKNYISMYMCILLPVAMSMFVVYKNRSIQIVSGVCTAFAFCGLLVASSNSGYIGLFAMMFAMSVVFARNAYHFRKFMLGITIILVSSKLLRLFSFIMNDNSKGFEAIGNILIYSNLTYVLIAIFAIITVVLYLTKDSEFVTKRWPSNGLLTTVLVVFTAMIALFVCMFINYTFVDKTSDIGSFSQLLRFDARWGTHRGFFWIKGMEEYKEFDFIHKLFGCGCDSFYFAFMPHFNELLLRFNNTFTDCAHNEYLNYLVTQGILGLGCYLVIIITTICKAFKVSKENALMIIFMMPVITYSAQAIVNIANPIVTPFLFVFIALCECLSRKSCNVNTLE